MDDQLIGRKIKLKGYRLDKTGKLVCCVKHLDVSARLRQRSSTKVRVVPRRP
jgi:hypothetical protein